MVTLSIRFIFFVCMFSLGCGVIVFNLSELLDDDFGLAGAVVLMILLTLSTFTLAVGYFL